jgi:hypothetical protein
VLCAREVDTEEMLTLTPGTVVNVSKFNENDGNIGESLITRGSGSYAYAWSDGKVTTPYRANVKAGRYAITATDTVSQEQVSHSYTVRQPRRRVDDNNNNVYSDAKTSKWAAGRNFFYIDEAPAPPPPYPTTGEYTITPSGVAFNGSHLFGFQNDAWQVDNLVAETVIAAGTSHLSTLGLDLTSADASIYFANRKWRIRVDATSNNDLVFEKLVNGAWLKRSEIQ